MDSQDQSQQQSGQQGDGTQQGAPTPPPTQQSGQQGGAQPAGTQPASITPEPPKRIVSDEELGIGTVGDFATSIKIPPHNLSLNEPYFLKLMAGSISLMKEEKIKIIQSVPKLSQYQVDELIRILEEEKRKFAELDDKHQTKVRELQSKQEEDWGQLESQQQEQVDKEKIKAEEEALRQQIMGGGNPPEQNNPPQNLAA